MRETNERRTALTNDHIRIVQYSLLGSILVNLLLVLGSSIVIGGSRHKEQQYNNTTTQLFIGLMNLTVFSLILPVSQMSHPLS
jgi:Ca2+:H+ antiporter